MHRLEKNPVFIEGLQDGAADEIHLDPAHLADLIGLIPAQGVPDDRLEHGPYRVVIKPPVMEVVIMRGLQQDLKGREASPGFKIEEIDQGLMLHVRIRCSSQKEKPLQRPERFRWIVVIHGHFSPGEGQIKKVITGVGVVFIISHIVPRIEVARHAVVRPQGQLFELFKEKVKPLVFSINIKLHHFYARSD